MVRKERERARGEEAERWYKGLLAEGVSRYIIPGIRNIIKEATFQFKSDILKDIIKELAGSQRPGH